MGLHTSCGHDQVSLIHIIPNPKYVLGILDMEKLIIEKTTLLGIILGEGRVEPLKKPSPPQLQVSISRSTKTSCQWVRDGITNKSSTHSSWVSTITDKLMNIL